MNFNLVSIEKVDTRSSVVAVKIMINESTSEQYLQVEREEQ
ncbi:hypothetical protein [Cytobacillus oceanisediminis]|nr:hypothetical protein [Cytobacillus oceanisediminis]